jgi:hypothetical protein
MVILLMAIGSLLYWWLLMIIGDYSIDGYFWLLYVILRLLVVIIL